MGGRCGKLRVVRSKPCINADETALVGVAPLAGASPHKPKDQGFDAQSGHMPGLGFGRRVRHHYVLSNLSSRSSGML